MPILECERCRTKNRVPKFRLNARATCGKCGAFLREPQWIHHARQFKKTWPVLAIGLLALAYFVFRPAEPPRLTSPEPAWSATTTSLQPPAVPPQKPALASTLSSQTPTFTPQLAPIIPLFTCVPVAVASGSSKVYSRKERLAPMKITTPAGGNYLIKLVKEGTKRVVMSAYIAGGDTQEFKVPLGTYTIYYAEGDVWCGEKAAFGRDNTHLERLVGSFHFTRDAEGYNGFVIELTQRVNGNLNSEEVSDTNFSELVSDELSNVQH